MNKFNRILLASGLAATASLISNSPAFAGTTGTVNLSGTVPSTLTLTVTPLSNAATLQLTPGVNYSGVKIATLSSASTNSGGGLRVVASGTWKLASNSNASDTISITTLGEAATTTATLANAAKSQGIAVGNNHYAISTTGTTVAGNGTDSSIFIGYNVPANIPAGTYTGSITFTAFDN